MGEIRKCEVCGEEFEASGRRRKYCSSECRTIGNRIKARIYGYETYRKKKAQGVIKQPEVQKAAKKPKKISSLAEINAAARETGMNYGEYVARMGL